MTQEGQSACEKERLGKPESRQEWDIGQFRKLMLWLGFYDFELAIGFRVPDPSWLRIVRNILQVVLSPVVAVYFLWEYMRP
jgi:hypothetical protein